MIQISWYTVFTWLNAAAFISLVPKIDAVTIQNRPLATRCSKTIFITIILKSIVVPIKCGDYSRNSRCAVFTK